jgi:hypothetical protein
MSSGRWYSAIAVSALVVVLLNVPGVADSKARIVRLSLVEGKVEVDHNANQEFASAFLNMPVTEGMSVKTGDDGRAEIEFEDGSAVRLTPKTVARVEQLSLRDSGARVSILRLQEGTAYVSFAATKNDEFQVSFARETATPAVPARFRVQMNDVDAQLAVFTGEVRVTGPSGEVDAAKKQTVTFDLADQDNYKLAKNIEEDPFDQWDKAQTQYHERYSSANAYTSSNSSPYAYGTSDLNYYGTYFSAPGYGTVWQPYFAGAGWDPFSTGAWMYYPGFGYTFVSSYPWGWTPYHYGSWANVPNYGWCWQPSSVQSGWKTIPTVVTAPNRNPVPVPPATGTGTVLVGGGTPASPVVMPGSSLAIRQGSAGLGIPRGSIGNLAKIQSQVERTGYATHTVHASSVYAGAPSPVVSSGAIPVAGHSGSAGMHGVTHASVPSAPHASPAPHGSSGSHSSHH